MGVSVSVVSKSEHTLYAVCDTVTVWTHILQYWGYAVPREIGSMANICLYEKKIEIFQVETSPRHWVLHPELERN